MQHRVGRGHHLAALDGLRGVAAITVLLHHVFWLAAPDARVFLHGYLAVDMFFVLSGFVIGLSYEPRLIGGLAFTDYMKIRLTRLYPLMFLGIIIGLIVAVTLPIPGTSPIEARFVCQLLFVPYVFAPGILFALNGVQWSLMFELFANMIHALSAPWLSTARLTIFTIINGVLLFGVSHRYGWLSVGSIRYDMISGVPRVLFSFSAGVLLSRFNGTGIFSNFRLAPTLLALILPIAVLVCDRLSYLWWIDLVVVLLVNPALVATAATVELPRLSARGAMWLGNMSYPIYAVQAPILNVGWYLTRSTMSPQRQILIWAATVLSIFLLSWVAARYWDEPVRRMIAKTRNSPPSHGMVIE